MKRMLGAAAIAMAAATTIAMVPGAAAAPPTDNACQVTDPSYGHPGHSFPTFVRNHQVIENSERVILKCWGPLLSNEAGDSTPVGNATGKTVVYTGFPCKLAVGWLQQGHPGPLPTTFNSRQVTSASGHTTLICIFEKPFELIE